MGTAGDFTELNLGSQFKSKPEHKLKFHSFAALPSSLFCRQNAREHAIIGRDEKPMTDEQLKTSRWKSSSPIWADRTIPALRSARAMDTCRNVKSLRALPK